MKEQTFLHRLYYNRKRFKFIEILANRYWVFWDRKNNINAIYKVISHEARNALREHYKIEEDIAEWLVFEKFYRTYGTWCIPQLLRDDLSGNGSYGTGRILRDFLAENDADLDWVRKTERLKELQEEIDKEYHVYMQRGRTSVALGVRDTRLHRRLVPKKIRFIGARSGKVLGEIVNGKLRRYQ